MKIHEIIIDNVRGIEHLELKDLPDNGVFVISGDNEAGKSTLMNAIFTVLFFNHGSKSKDIRALKPLAKDVAPRISLQATIGPYEFKITKQWLKAHSSELQILKPRVENLSGRESDNRLAEILAEYTDEALLKASFMEQGLVEPTLAAAGIPALSTALDKATATDSSENSDIKADGSQETALMQAVSQEFEKYFTKAGSARLELKEAQNHAALAAAELEEKQRKVAELEGFISDVAANKEILKKAEKDLPQALTRQKQREESYLAAQKAAQAAQKAIELADICAESLTRAQKDLANRKALENDLITRKQTVSNLEEQAAQLAAELIANEKSAANFKKAADIATAELEAAATALDAARLQVQYVRAKKRVEDLEKLLEKIAQVDANILTATKNLPARPVSQEQADSFADLSQELAVAKAITAAQAAKLRLSGKGQIKVDGQVLKLDAVVPLEPGTKLEIGDITAIYEAGGESAKPATSAAPAAHSSQPILEQLKQRYADLAQQLGVNSVAQAREKAAISATAAEVLKKAQLERQELLGEVELPDLQAEYHRLQQELAELTDLSAVKLDLAQAEAIFDTAVQRHSIARDAAKAAAAALLPWQDNSRNIAAAKVQAQLEIAQSEVAQASARLVRENEILSNTALKAQEEAAQLALAAAQQQVEKALAERDAADPELAAALFESAKETVRTIKQRISSAREDILRKESHIEHAWGAEEELAQAQADAEAAKRKLDSVSRRAAAAQVLYTTLRKHQEAARRRYAAPFATALENFAKPIFGHDVSFELDEELAITTRILGGVAVDIADLSGGAREQLMILSRFAIASLAGATTGGLPVPVFIDDALGNTDPSRLDLMATVFSKIAKIGQVFVLTCVPQRYDAVVGKKDYPMRDLKKEI
ncbi:AAA family ATPase [Corynebacterium caspium]|uniref:AAA family ATPase n=1 Tax=Corynebacterium caspium TaxID=234828 RepID=UPI00036AF250|nr:AAA family ATPase [Corynebacterium caspium]WKD59482.1 chromosome segregation protein [Corynebacterium caspium DSM 44850]